MEKNLEILKAQIDLKHKEMIRLLETEEEFSRILYTSNLKKREFDKEAPQIFWPERGAVLKDTTRSEDEKYEAKPT